jgi:hypothetical protein
MSNTMSDDDVSNKNIIAELYTDIKPSPLDILFLLAVLWTIYMLITGKPIW